MKERVCDICFCFKYICNCLITLWERSLLQTVPTDILEKGKAIADAYNTPDEDFAPQNVDPNLKQLESIL